MIVTVTAHKGGVGKSMTAVHLAAYLAREGGEGGREASVLLVDTDPNGTSLGWQRRSKGRLPFVVVGPAEAGEAMERFEHTVVDTQGRPRGSGLVRLVEGCDFLVVPSQPPADDLEALMLMVDDLEELGEDVGGAPYKVLITMAPWWNADGPKAHRQLGRMGVPIFERTVRFRQAFRSASKLGVPVYEVKGIGARACWEDYRAVGREVMEAVRGRVGG